MSPSGEAAVDELQEDLAQIVSISERLQRWQDHPWNEVQKMARAVGPLILGQLTARDLWDRLPPAVQAQVHWTMADGYLISTGRRPPKGEGPKLRTLAHTADQFAVICGAYAVTRMPAEWGSGWSAEFTARFDALPEGWRVEVIRHAQNRGDIKGPIGEAPMLLNVLRSVYGIDARLSQPPDSPDQ